MSTVINDIVHYFTVQYARGFLSGLRICLDTQFCLCLRCGLKNRLSGIGARSYIWKGYAPRSRWSHCWWPWSESVLVGHSELHRPLLCKTGCV